MFVILAYYSCKQSASSLLSVILSSVAYPALPYPSTLSHKRHDFKKIMEQKVCYDFFYNFFRNTCSKKHPARCVGLYVRNPLFLSYLNKTPNFSRDIRKILKYQILKNPSNRTRVVPCGQTHRRMDRHKKTISRFSKFCERAEKPAFFLTWCTYTFHEIFQSKRIWRSHIYNFMLNLSQRQIYLLYFQSVL